MPRTRHVVQDAATATRTKILGELGEQLAVLYLARNGFANIKNLNTENPNARYADLVAERDGQTYVISVKTRNKYEHTGKLNDRYKLSKRLAKTAEEKYKAKAAWITISLESKTFSAYFGLLSQLKSEGVPMTSRALAGYECLAKDLNHGLDYSVLENKYCPVTPSETQ